MSAPEDLVRVVLVGGPLDGEAVCVRANGPRVRNFVEPLGTGPLGFPLVKGHDYARDADGVWRYVPIVPPSPLPEAA